MRTVTRDTLSGRYLGFEEREEIAILKAQGHGIREIARRLKRSPSTISRELRRVGDGWVRALSTWMTMRSNRAGASSGWTRFRQKLCAAVLDTAEPQSRRWDTPVGVDLARSRR